MRILFSEADELIYAHYYISPKWKRGTAEYTEEDMLQLVDTLKKTQTDLYGEPEYYDVGANPDINEDFEYYKWTVNDINIIIEIHEDLEYVSFGHEYSIKYENRYENGKSQFRK